MGTIGSLALGLAFGLVFTAVMVISGFARAAAKDQRAVGCEVLPKGAAAWQPIPTPDGGPIKNLWPGANGKLLVSTDTRATGSWWNGSAWETTTEYWPQRPTHPTVADTMWRLLPDGTWLTARAGTDAPVLEPSKTVLPALPDVEKEKFELRLLSATRTSDGALLAIVAHRDGVERGWRLAAGATAWTDTGPVPIVALMGDLVAGWERDALLVGGGGAMARFDGERWTKLPALEGERIGWQGALTERGDVLAGGGFVDTARAESRVSWGIALGVLVAALLAARLLKASVLAMAIGGGLGVGLAVAGFFVLWILLGARF